MVKRKEQPRDEPVKLADSDARAHIKRLIVAGNTTKARQVYAANRIGLPNLERMVSNADLKDAVNLYMIAPEDDRKKASDTLAKRIVNSKNLTEKEQDKMLVQSGLKPPAGLGLERFKRNISQLHRPSPAKAN
jgi:hypothetical protein